MPVSYKVLAQGELGTTSSNFYTVPANTQTVISSITFHNRTNSEVEVSLNTVAELGILGSWTTSQYPFTSNASALSYGGGQYVVGNALGQLATSTDGLTWQTRSSSFVSSINAIQYGNGIFVAGGNGGALATSTDGVTWVTRNGLFGTSNITAIGYGNSLFVAGGIGGALRTSTNGITWSSSGLTGTTTTITHVSYANDRFFITSSVALGTTNLRTSTDGISWSTTTITGTNSQNYDVPVAYFNNQYVAWAPINTAFALRASTNGITWTSVRSFVELSRLFVVNDYLMGFDSGETVVHVSSDITTWSTRRVGFGGFDYALNNDVVMLGGAGFNVKLGNYASGADFPNLWNSVMERTDIGPYSSVTLNLGVTLGANNKLFARCNASNAVTISAFGREES